MPQLLARATYLPKATASQSRWRGQAHLTGQQHTQIVSLSCRKVLANEHHRHRRRSSSHTRSYSPAQTCASGHTLPHKQQGRQPAAVLEQQAADLTASAKSSLGRLGLKEGLKCAFCHPASEPLLPYLYLACNSQQCMVNRAPEEFIDNLWRAVSTIMALAQVLQEVSHGLTLCVWHQWHKSAPSYEIHA